MARAIIQGFAEQGGYTITTDGRTSTTKAQRSFPGCTVDVFLAGTTTPASIFSDVGGTPKANPFIASTDGYWFFWADDGSYDVRFSGGGIVTPFTLFNFTIGQSGALNDPGINGMLSRTSANTVTARTITGVTNETLVTNGNGVSGNPTIGLATFLEFTGRTLNGGTYLSPGIASFASAQHSHSDAVGGGQMNATTVFNAGTVPVARLPVMVGASGIANGTAGLVPQPLIADAGNFLRGDGVWATAGGGGGGTPGGASTTVQYNNAGTFGGVSGATSDGTNITFGSTNLRATSPRITTDIRDANGNAIITLNAVGSSVNNLQLANAALGGTPTLSAIGTDTNINITITPKGSGQIMTPANMTLSNVAPQITFIDTNDAKQARLLLSGNNLSLVNDTAAVTPLNIDMVSSAVTLAGSLSISNGSISITSSNPAITFDDTAGTDAKIDHDASVLRFGSTVANHVTLDVVSGVMNFTQIPTGPNADPTTGNQLARKTYVDTRVYPFSINFYEYDPSSSTVVTEDRPYFNFPFNLGSGLIYAASLRYIGGSAMPGGSSIGITFRYRDSAGNANDWATITMTTHAVVVNHLFDIADLAVGAGGGVSYYFSSRVGTINPRNLSITLYGQWRF